MIVSGLKSNVTIFTKDKKMKKQNNRKEQWPYQLQELVGDCIVAQEMVEELDEQRIDNVILQPIKKQLLKVESMASRLHERMCRTPARKLFSPDRMTLTEQEYYFLRATGCNLFDTKALGLSPVSDYEAFVHFCYEDDEKVCFIDSREKLPVHDEDKKTGTFSIRIPLGCSPEELHVKHLRPEQKKFFRECLPGVYDRFQKNGSEPAKSL